MNMTTHLTNCSVTQLQSNEIWVNAKYYRMLTGKVEDVSEIEVSNLGRFRYKGSNKIINPSKEEYPRIEIKKMKFRCHVLVASSFLSTPNESGYNVDHIDRDKKNFNLNNLRFVSPSTNNKNKDGNRNYVYVKFINNKIENIIYAENLSTEEKHKFLKTLDYKSWFIFQKYAWDIISPENLLKILNNDTSLDWRQIFSKRISKYYISKIGIIKIKRKQSTFFTAGTKNGEYLKADTSGKGEDRTENFIGKEFAIHRIMGMIYLNNGIPLKDTEIVDHIDTNTKNNNLDNLRIVSSLKDNMANENTVLNLSKPIKAEKEGKIVYFLSIKIASSYTKTVTSSIWKRLNGITNNLLPLNGYSKFSYLTEEEITKYKNVLIRV